MGPVVFDTLGLAAGGVAKVGAPMFGEEIGTHISTYGWMISTAGYGEGVAETQLGLNQGGNCR